MRKLVPVTLMMIMLLGLVPLLSHNPLPAYAQSLSDMPDLSGLNIYFSEANNEPSQFDRSETGVSRFASLLRMMGANTFTLEWRKGIPADADLIVIPGPGSDLSADMVARLWAYIQRGGRVMLSVDAFDTRGRTTRIPAGLFELVWSDIGIQSRADVVVVPGESGTVELVETGDDGEIISQQTVETVALAQEFLTQRTGTAHPITDNILANLSESEDGSAPNLSHFWFDGAQSLELNGALATESITPLLFAEGSGTYGEVDYSTYQANGVAAYNIGTDTPPGDLILAAAYDDPSIEARMVVISDRDFMTNGGGFITSPAYSGAFVYPLNVQFAVRSVAWLMERDITSLDLPAPGPTATPTITPSPTPTFTPTPATSDDES